ILQEMAARLGIISHNGLGEALRTHFSKPASKLFTAILVISAITIGNAAFQTGNLLGASLGLETLFGSGAPSASGSAAIAAGAAAAGSAAPVGSGSLFSSGILTLRFWVAINAAI